LVISTVTGESLLKLIGTSLASFRVGGGIVLLLMALAMLRVQVDAVRTSSAEAVAAEEKQSVAVVTLGLLLLVGLGSISTVIIEMQRSTATFHPVMVIVCILLVSAALWLVLRLAVPIGNTSSALSGSTSSAGSSGSFLLQSLSRSWQMGFGAGETFGYSFIDVSRIEIPRRALKRFFRGVFAQDRKA
jgi:MarC family integral membrane protein